MPSLPFLYRVELREQGGAVVATFSASIWPATRSASDRAGEVFDHTGEAPVAHAAALAVANRSLVPLSGPFAGQEIKIVAATAQTFMPSCDFELRRVKPTGG